ncbi:MULTISPECIES: alpha/beta hydrolase family protein [Paenibacillus]|uniref:alpha/beta hydrolase family protein n=1 Tax=Paenibacillus TaxID=44249 RepID=UPI00215B5E28|nr:MULTISPECIES: alpha/beta fold hydrolase [Paenibacillus]QYK65596.1 Platelet-activating factor acetylhydrolase, isoform II [Paenibacillus sp. S02]
MIGNAEFKKGYAGYREVKIDDASLGITFPMTVMYPVDNPEQVERLGPYLLELARGAEPSGGRLPLVIISHGTGGSPLVYRTLAQHLARNGFIVGMPEHPYNNRNDNSLEGTVQNLAYRPRHLRMATDWFFESKMFKEKLMPNAVSIIGHSLGGYTALAAAGGMPTSFPHEASDGKPQLIEVTRDHRIKSLVLLAPAAVWFRAEGALRAVNLPILMLDAEKDPYTPPFHAQMILGGAADPKKIQYRTVENAGHYSFLSPFPESMKTPAFLPSQDPSGFDREYFHKTLIADILDFLYIHHDARCDG